jgi:hypothetical protein
MSNAISRVQNNTSGAARGVEAKHCLQRHKQSRHVEGFEEDFRRLLPIPSRIERRFSEQHRVFFREGLQLILAAARREMGTSNKMYGIGTVHIREYPAGNAKKMRKK